MLLPSAPPAIRNNDVEHDYRQDSDLFYLTGFEEPHALLLLTTAHEEVRSVLFMQSRDETREVWDGARLGVERACEVLGVDAAHPIDTLAEKLPEYLAGVERLFVSLGRQRTLDETVFRAVAAVRKKERTGVKGPREYVEPGSILHPLRLVKGAEELATMRRAADITREAHLAAMGAALPGRYEYEVEAEIQRVFRTRGSARPAYGSIVGSGPNATVLHYRKNDRRMADGDLLLVDAGCELDYYASDVTRTYPVSGTFSGPQRDLYEVVLEAQRVACEAVEPGATVDSVHKAALGVIVDGLRSLGLVAGTNEQILEEELYKPFYMHRTSHWLGMDVHDVGGYFHGSGPRTFEPGYVLTVEPGLYVSPSAEVDERFKGIGIRIEDDVLVTGEGHENLTAEIPKNTQDLEALLAGR